VVFINTCQWEAECNFRGAIIRLRLRCPVRADTKGCRDISRMEDLAEA